ncbi:hypothetical protein JCGZ_21805 [Jatropha curcas]|uniref:C2H2-type domain-containing protein n=1 Tax=Jatropha curcas TaxID=180498 RepID=A0A067JP76_JATCU|nr:zinc finger protein 11 [Jatropha curcas]KDP21334.1 hypothetical protein JCGZ_21805 [Jatropha curcas]
MERTCLGSEDDNSSSSGFLWPQRNYTCSFCKRQFNSAQALGGHMNVHRRDRAMLIQLPSWVFDCPNPNPNFPSSASLSSSTATSSPSHNNDNNNKKMLPYPYYYNNSSPFGTTSFTLPSNNQQKKSNLEFPQSEDLAKKRMKKSMRAAVVEVEEFNKSNLSRKYERIEVLKNNEVISLELEIGCKDPKEVLDLELRLGCF